MRRPLFAVCRIVRRPDHRREPYASLAVEHGVVHVGLAVPYGLAAPIGRRLQRLIGPGRLGIAHRHFDLRRGVTHGVEHGDVVGRKLGRTVEQAVRVDRGIALVGSDLVVEVGLRTGPIPHRDDHVALHALRPRRRRRKLAGSDACGPVAEHGECALLPHSSDAADHRAARLPRLDAALPGLRGRIERAEGFGNLARRLRPQLVAGPAAIRLDQLEEFGLALDVG